MAKTALITGATSGIGEATARLLAKNNYNLIICGRRKERLDQLSEELSAHAEVTSLLFDVRNREEVFQAIDSIPVNFKDIDILINNAGNAHGLAPIQDGDMDDWDAMMDINVKGLLYVSRAILPRLMEKKSGHIVNIGSIAGKEVYAGGGVYCASKYAVDAINKGMLIDLNKYGIKVSAVNPGMVHTEFSLVRFKGDEEKARKPYEGLQPLVAEDVADVIYFIISRPAHVNLADVLLLPTAQATATIFNRTS
ncbi:SDR family NAD(P)-dependent oxidoreductase [soil metagenome]